MDASALFGVRGRVALVTGGSSGIGLMIAKVQIQMTYPWGSWFTEKHRDLFRTEPKYT